MEFSEEEYLAALSTFEVLTSAKIASMLKQYSLPSKVFSALESGVESLAKHLSSKDVESIKKNINTAYVKNYIANLEKGGIKFLSIYGKLSDTLKNLFEMCSLVWLYYKGDLSLLEKDSICIVGTRMPDAYGKKVTEDFTAALSKAGLVIVSGLAAGIDSIAHNTCLKNGGKTIAVLGGGFGRVYPAFNASLADKIAEDGLLLSEYAPSISPNSYHFPVRNRIIAAISKAALITQMGEKSGAMHTKNYAVEYGKNLYIVGADCYREASAGNLRIIEEMPEAVVVSPSRILCEFGLFLAEQNKPVRQLSMDEQAVVNCLKEGEKHFDDLAAQTNLPAGTLLSLLTSLKIDGIITQLPANYYTL